MSTKVQQDCLLGGPVDLPSSVNTLRYTASRYTEITQMRETLAVGHTGVKLAFQKLPKHMRRRAMSHNAKRLPRKVREIHLSQMKKSGMPPKAKPPSRKHRRRPTDLIAAYTQRQCKKHWLFTHIWHAKRFHMVERWGYRLADRPCDKGFRALYRASARHCFIQDVSFIACVELNGPFSVILEKFKEITDVSVTGMSIAAKSVINGNRQGDITLFHPDTKRPIGPISFQWKPDQPPNRAIWCWIHAAYYQEALAVLKTLFTKTNDNSPDKVTISELRRELSRFRLRGPLAMSVLQQALKTDTKLSSDWLETHLKQENNQEFYTKELEYWNSCAKVTSAGCISPNSIINLVVMDPRYNYPTKRTKAVNFDEQTTPDVCLNVASSSPLWDLSTRTAIASSKISNGQVASIRAKQLVPGEFTLEGAVPIPVIVIQSPGYSGFAAGFDVIVSSNWAQSLWLSLILWGGRAGGLHDANHLQLECQQYQPSGIVAGSIFAPDTNAGRQMATSKSAKLFARHFSLPPNKRSNYVKLAVQNPFSCPWSQLLQDWTNTTKMDIETTTDDSSDNFLVLRNKQLLLKLQQQYSSSPRNKKEIVESSSITNELVPGKFIVAVKLKMVRGGVMSPFTMICLPKVGDSVKKKEVPTEPLRQDVNESDRRKLRKEHAKLLRQMRRKRVKAKLKGKILPLDNKLITTHASRMQSLWLPPPGDTIRNHCTREIIGFVTTGDFSFSQGCYAGVGFIAADAIPELLRHCRYNHRGESGCHVLVRPTSSRQYRWATLQLIV